MSNSRSNRRMIAENTLTLLERGFFENKEGELIDIKSIQKRAEQNTKVYNPLMSDELIQNRNSNSLTTSTIFNVTNESTLDAVRRLIDEGNENIACLNFASAKNPGGGFLGGSQAQEESLARSTGLYNCLLKGEEYYRENRKFKSCFYTDYMIYSPVVPILKNEEGLLLEKLYTASIITAPAVNKGVLKKGKITGVEEVMKQRIEKVLAVFLENGHKNIVLGAWGCGVFQNDPKDISLYFKEVIEAKFKNEFEKITFAIYASGTHFIKPFLANFTD